MITIDYDNLILNLNEDLLDIQCLVTISANDDTHLRLCFDVTLTTETWFYHKKGVDVAI